MAYNKADEENKWRNWKVREEKKLRELGVDENVIESLRQFDWEIFKSERRYKEHRILAADLIEQQAAKIQERDIYNIQQLFEEINNEQLLFILLRADKKTLQVILLKMMGYSMPEICNQVGLRRAVVFNRLSRLKKKLKKFYNVR